MAESEPKIVGRYELHSEIAAGGMASVYLGRLMGAAGFSKCVAIKRLHSHMAEDPEFVASLLQEARLAERVRHPNVVATIDVVAEDKELLLVMEYVHGETLARLLRACTEAGQPCPPEIAARIVHDTLLGLHAAHNSTDAAGKLLCIVHRDVSPQNVMVGADGVTRLVDFGVAKALGSIGHTREGHLKGKIAYMAPELLRYEPPTPQTDVWAAAVVLWEARCSRRLFRGDSEIQVWGQVLSSDIPDPETVTGTPSALDVAIMRGLSRDPVERYATALEMAEDIERCIRLASPAEVAAFVTQRAGASLAAREAVLRAVEAAPPASASPVTANVAGDAPRRSRAWVIPALVVVGSSVGAAGYVVSRNVPSPAASVLPIASSAPPESSAPAPQPSASASTTPIASATPSASATTSTTPTTPRNGSAGRSSRNVVRHEDAAAPPAPIAASSSAKAADCDPPYSVDATGRKIFKLECVREK